MVVVLLHARANRQTQASSDLRASEADRCPSKRSLSSLQYVKRSQLLVVIVVVDQKHF